MKYKSIIVIVFLTLSLSLIYSKNNLDICVENVKKTQNKPKIGSSGLDPVEVGIFWCKLQECVANNDRQNIAEMVQYPTEVAMGVEFKVIKSKKEFIDNYDVIVDEKVKNTILTQGFEDLHSSWQGVTAGRGEIWINKYAGLGQKMQIIKINNGHISRFYDKEDPNPDIGPGEDEVKRVKEDNYKQNKQCADYVKKLEKKALAIDKSTSVLPGNETLGVAAKTARCKFIYIIDSKGTGKFLLKVIWKDQMREFIYYLNDEKCFLVKERKRIFVYDDSTGKSIEDISDVKKDLYEYAFKDGRFYAQKDRGGLINCNNETEKEIHCEISIRLLNAVRNNTPRVEVNDLIDVYEKWDRDFI